MFSIVARLLSFQHLRLISPTLTQHQECQEDEAVDISKIEAVEISKIEAVDIFKIEAVDFRKMEEGFYDTGEVASQIYRDSWGKIYRSG